MNSPARLSFAAAPPDGPDLSDILRRARRALQRQSWIVILYAIVGAALALAFGLQQDRYFDAHSTILIDPRVDDGMGRGSTAPTIFLADALVIDSEIEVLTSQSLLLRVADSLIADPSVLRPAVPPDRREAAEWIAENLEIERQGDTFVIAIRFRAADPDLAALVANRVASEYVAAQGDEQGARVERATAWLRSELARLEGDLAEREAAVQAFLAENDVPSEGTRGFVDVARAEVEAAIVDSRAALREAEAERNTIVTDLRRLDSGGPIGGLLSVALADGPGDLQRQLQEAQARAAAADTASAVRALERIVPQVETALVRLRETREARIALERANLAALEAERARLRDEQTRVMQAQMELRGLVRSAGAIRDQHDTLMSRLQESESADRYFVSATRVIDAAAPPREPANPTLPRLGLAGVLAGALLGVGLVFLREQFDDSVRWSSHVTEGLGLPYLGPAPVLNDRRRVSAKTWPGAEHLPTRQRRALALLTGFATGAVPDLTETLRRTELALRRGRGDGGAATVIAVTSARTGEGKTVFAANLALFLASRGLRVVLCDGDPHKRRLTRMLPPGDARDAAEAGPVTTRDLPPGPVFLGPASEDAAADPAGYVAALVAAIEAHRTAADAVIVDAPPFGTTAEMLCGADIVDRAILVSGFGMVSMGVIRRALAQRSEIADKIMGVVIGRIRTADIRRYEEIPLYYAEDGHA